MTKNEKAAILEIADNARRAMRSKTEILEEILEDRNIDKSVLYESIEYLQKALGRFSAELEILVRDSGTI